MKLKQFSNIVEGPEGLKMPENIARKIEAVAKTASRDFHYQRIGKMPTAFRLEPGERADVSTITTNAVDRDGDVILPEGIDLTDYRQNRVVTYFHDYSGWPIGSCLHIKDVPDGLVAKTIYPEKAPDWGDSPWPPSAVLHFMRQDPPMCIGKSIGFFPEHDRQATPQELQKHPDWNGRRIIDKAKLFEYAVCTIPANQEALMLAVAKSIGRDGIDEEIAKLILSPFGKLMEAKSIHPSIMAPLPAGHAAKLRAMAEKIKPEHFADGGIMATNCCVHSHIGTEDMDKVKAAIGDQAPMTVKCGKTFIKPATKDRNTDTVCCAMHSPEMEKMVNRIKTACPGARDMKYQPHVPLAEVKPGCGKDYDGMDDAEGMCMGMNHVKFITHDGSEHDIHFTGKDMADGDPDLAEMDDAMKAAAEAAKKAAEASNGNGGFIVNPSVNAMPPCPKCNKADQVEAKGDHYCCKLCKTEFFPTDAWRAGEPKSVDPDYGCDAIGEYLKANTAIDHEDFTAFALKHTFTIVNDAKVADPLDIPAAEIARMAKGFISLKAARAKAMSVNHACVARAIGLVKSGKVNKDHAEAPNGGDRKPEDCLAFDTSEPKDSAAYCKYPVIINGEVAAKLVANAEARATQNSAPAVAAAARKIMQAIQAREKAIAEPVEFYRASEVAKAIRAKKEAEAKEMVRKSLEAALVLDTGFSSL